MTVIAGFSGWVLELEASEDAAPTYMEALEGLAIAVSCHEIVEGAPWRVEAIFGQEPAHGAVAAAVALAAAATGTREPDFVVRPLPARDWLAENRASFKPVRAGRFFVHPTHFAGVPPAGARALALDAATAFGSGEHGTTRGCLLALDALTCRRPQWRPRVLDMGCGSGILALAAARAWPVRVLAVDIDPEAVRVTAENARINRLSARIASVCGNGFAALPGLRAGRFDVILANILARPLQAMAPALARRLAPGGTAILSGLLVHQEAQVLAAYRAQNLALLRRIRIDGWSTLVLRRGQTP